MIVKPCYDIKLLSGLFKELAEDEQADTAYSDEELFNRMKEFVESSDKAFIFSDGDSLIGYALVIFDKKPLYLRHFYICRDQRRKGYGKLGFKLLLSQLNTDTIDLDVYTWNKRGRAFWESLGFKPRAVMMRYNSPSSSPN